MARVEITDRESAEAWLREQPHQIRIWFAVRCALRAVPGLQAEPENQYEWCLFFSFRALHRVCAAATCESVEFDDFKDDFKPDSRFSRLLIPWGVDGSYSSIERAIRSAIKAVSSDCAKHAAMAAEHSASATGGALPEFTMNATQYAYSAASSDTSEIGRWPPLWHESIPTEINQLWLEQKQKMQAAPEKWAFWLEWYAAILEGKPLDWDLTRRIAREVTGAEWASGPEVVARRIEEIRARSELERRIGALEQSRDDTQSTASRLGIGGNNPPEPLGEVQGIAREVTIVWASVDELKTQVRSRTPDKDRVSEIVETLSLGLRAILRWCSHKADLAVDTLIKWGIPVGGAALVANPELLKAVIEAARNWLSFL